MFHNCVLGAKSEEYNGRWKGFFLESIRKVIIFRLKCQIHITDEAMCFIESSIVCLFVQLYAPPRPLCVQDVEERLNRIIPISLRENCLEEAHEFLNRNRKKSSIFLPLEKMHAILSKDIYRTRIDSQLSLYMAVILEFILHKIVKLICNYEMHIPDKTKCLFSVQDVKTALLTDKNLSHMLLQVCVDCENTQQQLSAPLRDTTLSLLLSAQVVFASSHLHAVRQLFEEQRVYQHDLNIIIRIFYSRLESCHDFTRKDIDTIFCNIFDIYECACNVINSIEDVLFMSDEDSIQMNTAFCFQELAGSSDLAVYNQYARGVFSADWNSCLHRLLAHNSVRSCLRSAGHGFYEAVKYVLPRLILVPVVYLFRLFAGFRWLQSISENKDIIDSWVQTQSILTTIQGDIEHHFAQSHLRQDDLRKWRLFSFGIHSDDVTLNAAYLKEIALRVENFNTIDIDQSVFASYITEGELGCVSSKSTSTRYVFLFCGALLVCKYSRRRYTSAVASSLPINSSAVPAQPGELRLKHWFYTSCVSVSDTADTVDLRNSFEVVVRDSSSSMVFFCDSLELKEHWLSCIVMTCVKPMLENSLEVILRDEKNKNPLKLPDDTSKYCFSSPDRPDNIILVEQCTSATCMPVIKGATLFKLIEWLTHHVYSDPAFTKTFLTTYRSFCTPQRLLSLLIERYNVPESQEESLQLVEDPQCVFAANYHSQSLVWNDYVKRYYKEYSRPIRLRVLNVFRRWVDEFFDDFRRDSSLLVQLENFISSISERAMKRWAYSIFSRITRKHIKSQTETKCFSPSFTLPPIEYHIVKNFNEWQFPDDDIVLPLFVIHPVELARQLTLYEFELFRAIRPSELVGSVWTKADKHINSPNLLRLIRHNTNVTRWLERSITETDNFEERKALLARIIEIIMVLNELNNFGAMMEFVSALDGAAVHRLSHTFQDLSPRLVKSLQDARELTADHCKHCYERLRLANPPCIPFMGMYLTHILHIEDGNPNFLPTPDQSVPTHEQTVNSSHTDHVTSHPTITCTTPQDDPEERRLINFAKRQRVADITAEVQRYQNQGYNFQPISSVQKYIANLSPFDPQLDQDEVNIYLFNRSQAIEPKSGRPSKEPRRWERLSLKSPGIKPRRLGVTTCAPPHSAAPTHSSVFFTSWDTKSQLSPITPSTPVTPLSAVSSQFECASIVSTVRSSPGTVCDNSESFISEPPPSLPPRRPKPIYRLPPRSAFSSSCSRSSQHRHCMSIDTTQTHTSPDEELLPPPPLPPRASMRTPSGPLSLDNQSLSRSTDTNIQQNPSSNFHF